MDNCFNDNDVTKAVIPLFYGFLVLMNSYIDKICKVKMVMVLLKGVASRWWKTIVYQNMTKDGTFDDG